MRSSLRQIAATRVLRCDAKQSEDRFLQLDALLDSVPTFRIGEHLPFAFGKGRQPEYVDGADDGVPVINTLSVQKLSIRPEFCRYISRDAFEALEPQRNPSLGDLLLTLDGGTSIGKPAVFDLEGDFAVDSHVAVLRPRGMDAMAMAYLLASPLGQLQFLRAESGASGQTSVSEEDVRSFRFPSAFYEVGGDLVAMLSTRREEIAALHAEADRIEAEAWAAFARAIASGLG